MATLTERQKHLIGLGCVMKIRHFQDPKVAIKFDSALVEACILEYEEILDVIGFDYNKQRPTPKG